MTVIKRTFALGTAVLVLAACATKPVPQEPEVVQRPAPQPEIFTQPEPEPAPPQVIDRPVVQPPMVDPNLPIPGSIEDFAFQSGGEPRVFFGYDRFQLSNEARDTLRRQADWLNSYPSFTAIVEGHADERGTREYNLALGARRADSVKAFLVSQGVSPDRLTTVSYGKERPIDGRSNEAGWSRNRNGFTNLRAFGQS